MAFGPKACHARRGASGVLQDLGSADGMPTHRYPRTSLAIRPYQWVAIGPICGRLGLNGQAPCAPEWMTQNETVHSSCHDYQRSLKAVYGMRVTAFCQAGFKQKPSAIAMFLYQVHGVFSHIAAEAQSIVTKQKVRGVHFCV